MGYRVPTLAIGGAESRVFPTKPFSLHRPVGTAYWAFLLIAMAAYFFAGAGAILSVLLFIVLRIGAIILAR